MKCPERLTEGFGAVSLPFALERKYPQASHQWGWQYIIPVRRRSSAQRRDTSRARVATQPAPGPAWTLLAHPLARAVSDLRQRTTAVAMDTCRQREGRRAGAPAAALDTLGLSLSHACPTSCRTASLTANVRRGR